MAAEQSGTYEKLYYTMWEIGQRYGEFAQFRVIGRSHDDRMIPMLEIGKGDRCIFCLSGIESGDGNLPEYLLSNIKEYCVAYESNWIMGESYEVQRLLDKVRICAIPILNPDSYEISEKGYGAIRNPIYRQMLKMQDKPVDDYESNARGIDLRRNFPTIFFRNIQVKDFLPSVIQEERSFTADRRKDLLIIKEIIGLQGICRNVQDTVWKKESPEVQ